MRGLRRSPVLRRGAPVVLALALVASVSSTNAGAIPKSKATSWIVVLKEGTDPAAVARSVGASPRRRYMHVFRGFAAALTDSQLARLDGDSRVLSLNENRVIGRVEPTTVTRIATSGFRTADEIPPGHPPQFVTNGVERIGGLESPTAKIDGQPDPMDVDVAVLDTGVFNHLDLNLAGGFNCAAGTGFDDMDGHGTLVAGFVGAKDNAFGAVGIAPGARIWAVRVADPDGTITTETEICALDWVRQHGDIEVANMSFGGQADPGDVVAKSCSDLHRNDRLNSAAPPTKKQALDPEALAICSTYHAGVTLVAGAGNESSDVSNFFPAAYSEVIAVSALSDLDGRPGGLDLEGPCPFLPDETDDTFATFSNFGRPIDIAAPGVCISSTFKDNDYAVSAGTSFAAPLVSGAAALLKVRHPGWTPHQIRQYLLKTEEPGPIPGDPDHFKEGILNVRGY